MEEYVGRYDICKKANRLLGDGEKDAIPDWCPLPDASEPGRGEGK